jgi:hypothetical protein
MIKKIILTGVFVLLSTSAFGEYYQYTDESGNLRFSDDLSQVPEAQRPVVKTFQSEAGVPDKTVEETPSDSEEMQASEPLGQEDTGAMIETTDQPEAIETIPPSAGEQTLQTTATELDKMQSELNRTHAELEEERAALKAQAPKKNATSDERIEYTVKVDELNVKIDQYGEELKAFDEKVKAFNNNNMKVKNK